MSDSEGGNFDAGTSATVEAPVETHEDLAAAETPHDAEASSSRPAEPQLDPGVEIDDGKGDGSLKSAGSEKELDVDVPLAQHAKKDSVSSSSSNSSKDEQPSVVAEHDEKAKESSSDSDVDEGDGTTPRAEDEAIKQAEEDNISIDERGSREIDALLKSDSKKEKSAPAPAPALKDAPGTHSHEKWSSMLHAMFFSKYISFFWMRKLLIKGAERPLEDTDLEGIMPEECAMSLTEKMERNWYKEAYDQDGNMKKDPQLWRALFRTFGFGYGIMGILPALSEVGRILQPVFMGMLIGFFSELSADPSIGKGKAYGYAFAMMLCFFVTSWTVIPFTYQRQRFGVRARIALTGLVYRKVLNLNHAALHRSTTGYIVNLVSNDTHKLEFASHFLHYLWIGIIEVIVVTVLLYKELGPPALAGVGFLMFLTPVQMMMGRLIMYFRRKILACSDERVKIMNEIISGMKVIKLYTWEDSFSQWIKELRQREIDACRKLAWVRGTIMSFFFSSGALVSFMTFMVYVLAGNDLTARKVFTSVALFNVARTMLTMYFPIGVTLFNEARVAMDRIQRILLEETVNPENMPTNNLRPKLENCGVFARDLTASWDGEVDVLKSVSFDIKAGELLAFVGPVGCGKSSALMAILGELKNKGGSVDVKGRVSYASQEPWIFNGTLKYNITFGYRFDQKRYDAVIEACALKRDIELLAEGDHTLVGERGVSLSGGQRARVNLARAVYADADIYIMDDPLSAVDANVGRHLYDRCINGFLEDKVRILVTHQLQYLTDADVIVAMRGGRCIGKGTYYELSEMGIDFIDLVTKEDDSDTGIDTDFDGDVDASEELRRRRFSQQYSCPGTTPQVPTEGRKRAVSFMRQESRRYRSTTLLESHTAIAKDTHETVVYEEEEVVPKEQKMQGNVGFRIYVNFFRAGYGRVVWILLMLLFAICQVFYLVADWWLSYWSNSEENYTRDGDENPHRDRDLGIYAVLVLCMVFLGVTRALLFFKVMLKSSQELHNRMFDAVMKSPIYFFDTNSIGRILNRFSKDTSLVDDMLSFTVFDFLQSAFVVIGIFALVAAKMPLVIALVIPVLIIIVMLRMYYIKTAREVKRIEGLTRSPIYGHFSTTLLGLPTIRAFQVQEKFSEQFYDAQDVHTESYFTFMSCAMWMSFHLDLLCGFFIAFTCIVCVVLAEEFTPGAVGLMLSYAINIPGVFQQAVRQTTEVENQMTSVERIQEYADLEAEPPARTDVVPRSDWPQRGSIDFDDLSFRYHRTLPNILHHVNAHVGSSEKVGVCGRTGAGKSSLLSTLFRTAEPSGTILIDGLDIATIGVKDLRSKISIIPQDPVLFSGTMRRNLDPFSQYSDKDIWTALEEVQLKDAVLDLPGKLESEMAESGGNLSVGQRQLVCLARALLRNNKILVVDEATANVDPKTDSLIQETIREKFKHCTVLTIAHRLHTIMDSDKIMVLDAGKLKEFREPYKLLRCKNSLLYNLVAQTGPVEAQKLFEIALRTHNIREKQKNSQYKECVDAEMGDCAECRKGHIHSHDEGVIADMHAPISV